MKCRLCHAKIDDDAKVCGNCGNPVDPSPSQTFEQEVIEPQGEDRFAFGDGSDRTNDFGSSGDANGSNGSGGGTNGSGGQTGANCYCTNCGRLISPNAFFCPFCGAKVSRAQSSYRADREVSFGQAFALFWKNYVNFSGRSGSREFWFMVVWDIVISFALSLIGEFAGAGFVSAGLIEYVAGIDAPMGFTAIGLVFYILTRLWNLATLIPWLSLAIRRLHDSGRSGWWLFIGLIPLVGVIFLIVFFCAQSQPFANKYGK